MPNNNTSTKVELVEWLTSLVYPYNTPRFKGRPRNWGYGSGTPYVVPGFTHDI